MRLTESGLQIIERCGGALSTIHRAMDEMRHSESHHSGKLRITAPIFLAGEVLGQWLAEFAQLHPGISTELTLSNNYVDLIDEQVDLAIRLGPLDDSAFIAQFLHECRYLLCASPSYRQQYGEPHSVEDLKKHRYLKLSKAGLGITYLPDFIMGSELKGSRLERILPRATLKPSRNIYAVYPSRKYLPQHLKQCIVFLRHKFANAR